MVHSRIVCSGTERGDSYTLMTECSEFAEPAENRDAQAKQIRQQKNERAARWLPLLMLGISPNHHYTKWYGES
jgi:hypothetical protein